MAHWFLVTAPPKRHRLRFATLASLILCLFVYSSLAAKERREIRLYKANVKLQSSRIWVPKKQTSQPGCHNLYKKKRVYKTVVFGFAQCQLFARKHCNQEILVKQEKDELTTPNLLEGYGWYPLGEHKRGAIVRSWSCQPKALSSFVTQG